MISSFCPKALHHAERPDRLLAEVARVLKPSGVVMVIGEHVPQNRFKLAVRHVARYFLSRLLPPAVQRRLLGRVVRKAPLYPGKAALYPPDPVKGDQMILDSEYRKLFGSQGFSFRRLKPIVTAKGIQSFVLTPRADDIKA